MATFVNNGRQNGKGKEGLKNLTLEKRKKTKYSFHDDDVEVDERKSNTTP